MAEGQLALNSAAVSPGLFFKNASGALVKIGPVHVGPTAPNATPAAGGEAGNSVGEQWLDTSGTNPVLKIWDGSTWASEAGEFVNASGDVMTGALGIIAGTATDPGLYFSGDPNTGLYSPGADQVAISTNGTGRLFVDASGNVGFGTSSPAESLDVTGNIRVTGSVRPTGLTESGDASAPHFSFTSDTNTGIFRAGSDALAVSTNGTERARIDSSGRLLVGTSTSLAVGVSNQPVQIHGGGANGITLGRFSADAFASDIRFYKSRSATVGTGTIVQSGDTLGSINFYASDGADATRNISAARIRAEVDGTPGANDMPGRIVLSTTPSGSATPTERARLTSTGALLVGTTVTPTGAGSGAVVAENRVVVGSTGSGSNQILVGALGTVTASTGTIVFKFKSSTPTTVRSAFIKLAISQRSTSNTVTNHPAAEYAFQLHHTTGGVCTLNGATTIFEYTYVRATHFAFADLGSGECTVTLTNPVAVALTNTYRVELLGSAGAWTLDSFTVT
jgi:hypothetical protein